MWECDTKNNRIHTRETKIRMESTSAKTPADFLKSIRGKRVVVKLNSGVDYRGTQPPRSYCYCYWVVVVVVLLLLLRENFLFLSLDDYDGNARSCLLLLLLLLLLSDPTLTTTRTSVLFYFTNRDFSVLRWIHEHCNGTHRGECAGRRESSQHDDDDKGRSHFFFLSFFSLSTKIHF